MALFIIQATIRKKISKGVIGVIGHFFGPPILKIHSVEAETEPLAIEILKLYYETEKPNYELKIIDTEGVISIKSIKDLTKVV